MKNHGRLLQVQKRIYQALKRQADELLGPMPASIRKYEKSCLRDFKNALQTIAKSPSRGPEPIQKSELVQAIRGADAAFIADFHAFPQAQRTALRLLRECVREDEAWILGLEMFSSRDQWALDEYAAGRISAEELLIATRYAEDWGFPWRNYAPLIQEAIRRGMRLLALNRPRELGSWSAASRPAGATLRRISEVHELEERDRWAAGLITDALSDSRKQPKEGLRILVLYGDLHVGRRHLPAQLERVSREYLGASLRSVSVHQNQDALYWALAKQGREHASQILRLEDECYCVLSSTPWAKLQSLVSWAETAGLSPPTPSALAAAESGVLSSYTDEEDFEHEGDPLYWIQAYGEAITSFLRVRAPDYGTLHVFTLDDADFVDHLDRGLFDREEMAMVRHRVVANRCLYVRRAELAYLGSLSPNAAAELAAIHLFRVSTQAGGLRCATLEDAARAALEAAFGFFGSLIINPRRKCELPADIAFRYEDLWNHRAQPAFPLEEDALGLALEAIRSGIEALAPREGASGSREARDSLADRQARSLAADVYGRILGRRLYEEVAHGNAPLSLVHGLLEPRTQGAHERFESRIKRLHETVGVAPRSASKADTL